MIAYGSVGTQAPAPNALPTNLRTYLSRDNGVSWSEIADSVLDSHVALQGSVLLFYKYNVENTTGVLYSLDGGSTLQNLTNIFDDIKIQSVGRVLNGFLVAGDNGTSWTVSHLNFSTLGVRECVGFDTPGESNTSDYEIFSPVVTNRNGGCWNGESTTFIRRKSGVECIDTIDDSQKRLTEKCLCTRDDYEVISYFVLQFFFLKKRKLACSATNTLNTM